MNLSLSSGVSSADQAGLSRVLDTGRIAYWGHEFGAQAGVLALPFDGAFDAVVLDGIGGGVATRLLLQTNPVNYAGVMAPMLGERSVNENHPGMNIIQTFFEAIDPLNFGRQLTLLGASGQASIAMPMDAPGTKPLLQLAGLENTHTPDVTQIYFGKRAGLGVVPPVYVAQDAYPVAVSPADPSRAGFETAVQIQTALEGIDGHFASQQDPAALEAIKYWLGTFFGTGRLLFSEGVWKAAKGLWGRTGSPTPLR